MTPVASEVDRARARRYYAANREKVLAYQKSRVENWTTEQRSKRLAWQRQWRTETKEARRDQQRASYWRNHERTLAKAFGQRHGFTTDEAIELLAQRPSGCEVCGRSDEKLHFDHCHSTGKHRGWLCGHCNRALGLLMDDPVRLRRLADYLEKA